MRMKMKIKIKIKNKKKILNNTGYYQTMILKTAFPKIGKKWEVTIWP
jgi:hypothetical protein